MFSSYFQTEAYEESFGKAREHFGKCIDKYGPLAVKKVCEKGGIHPLIVIAALSGVVPDKLTKNLTKNKEASDEDGGDNK